MDTQMTKQRPRTLSASELGLYGSPQSLFKLMLILPSGTTDLNSCTAAACACSTLYTQLYACLCTSKAPMVSALYPAAIVKRTCTDLYEHAER